MSLLFKSDEYNVFNHSIETAIQQDLHDGWKAELGLVFTQRGDKTVLKHRFQRGPLAIQRPLYPDGSTCHTYLLHPPGGVVGGDSLNIDVTLEPDAQAFITTPGATKFYRSNQKYAHQTQKLTVKSGARLEWFPQENIFFPYAHSRLDTQVYLDSNAQFWGWEMHCFGRPALNEVFGHGHLVGKTEIFINKKRVLTEGLNFYGGDKLMINKGMISYPLIATLYVKSDDIQLVELVQNLLSIRAEEAQQLSGKPKLVVGVTQLEHLLIVRALGFWSEDLIGALSEVWQLTRQQLTGVSPDLPRIWAT
ncbi:urease accessory protein ureD [Vibrio sp. UCD-FRSSP16_10]|uniref:urease accessory protein UreD n=1 Tax=unclassified Vibrio TaxID=2614977 RepID=UPI0007FEDBF6|nr:MULTISPECIES: urease accessory protein UreD [unclassified Vibrio]OBT10129.1 urease accessory protein ureD [Vibrio sp. UCD-FRSSP16_30]OBT18919.1 urease accessory protein ureD [Vibrio sp. UCD-FRSSP16_10]